MTIDFDFLKPVLALVLWTLVMWIWMYALRLPAFAKYKINPDNAAIPAPIATSCPRMSARLPTTTITGTSNRRSSMP